MKSRLMWNYGTPHTPIFSRLFSRFLFSFVIFKVMMIKQERKCVIKHVQRLYNKVTTETSDEQYLIWNVNVNFHFRSLQIFCEKNIKLFNSIYVYSIISSLVILLTVAVWVDPESITSQRLCNKSGVCLSNVNFHGGIISFMRPFLSFSWEIWGNTLLLFSLWEILTTLAWTLTRSEEKSCQTTKNINVRNLLTDEVTTNSEIAVTDRNKDATKPLWGEILQKLILCLRLFLEISCKNNCVFVRSTS